MRRQTTPGLANRAASPFVATIHSRPTDREVAAIAHRQGGVVSRNQLKSLGLSPQSIDRRVRLGRLHCVHDGVYAVGHRLVSPLGRRWAAVLACGTGAVISWWSAAAGWELHRGRGEAIHVTVPDRRRIRRPGITVHRPLVLPADETTTLDGLPITTVARTVFDLAAAGLRNRDLEVVLDRAEARARVDWSDVGRLVKRYDQRPAARAIASTLARYMPGSLETLSVLEEIVLRLCDESAIPRPLVNHIVAGRRRDFFWPQANLVVEADGYAYHRSLTAFNDDRERDVELTLAGVRSLRFTYEQCTDRRSYVANSIVTGLSGSIDVE